VSRDSLDGLSAMTPSLESFSHVPGFRLRLTPLTGRCIFLGNRRLGPVQTPDNCHRPLRRIVRDNSGPLGVRTPSYNR